MMEFTVKKLSHNAIIPTRANENAAGMDLYSTEDYVLSSRERKLFKTDIAIFQKCGFYGKIEGRSGLAYKNGILVLGGVIDSDYTGNIGVILVNTSSTDFVVKSGDRIAQIIFHPYVAPVLIETDELPETERSDGGFGSTGR